VSRSSLQPHPQPQQEQQVGTAKYWQYYGDKGYINELLLCGAVLLQMHIYYRSDGSSTGVVQQLLTFPWLCMPSEVLHEIDWFLYDSA
jgi:hypothetical protein